MPLLEQPDAHLGDKVQAKLNKLQGSVWCSVPDRHRNIRHRARLLPPLMQAPCCAGPHGLTLAHASFGFQAMNPARWCI